MFLGQNSDVRQKTDSKPGSEGTLSRIKKICLDYRVDSTKNELQERIFIGAMHWTGPILDLGLAKFGLGRSGVWTGVPGRKNDLQRWYEMFNEAFLD